MNPDDAEVSFNKIENIGLLLGIISFAICFGIQTLLEKFRAHRIRYLERRLEYFNDLSANSSNPPCDSRKRKSKPLTQEQIDKRIKSIKGILRPARQGLQFNGIVGVYGAIPTALVVTSVSDGPYSAMAVFFGAVLGAHAFWGIIRKPRKMAPSMYWIFHIIAAGILIYLCFGPGLSLLIVDDFVVRKVEEADDAGFRVLMDFRNWPAPSIVRRIWLWLAVIEWTRPSPTGCDHFKWWSPEVGFAAKVGITAALFYAWNELPNPDIDIDGYLFQYATERWSGRHLIFLMYVAGLTFITVEKRRGETQEYLLTREERGEPLGDYPEESYHQYIWRTNVSSRHLDMTESSEDIEAPRITGPPQTGAPAGYPSSSVTGSEPSSYSNLKPNLPPNAYYARPTTESPVHPPPHQ